MPKDASSGKLEDELRRARAFDFGRQDLKEFPPPDPLGHRDGKGDTTTAAGVEDSNPEASILHKFAQETSAHGCAHAASPGRRPFSRVLWSLAVLGMLGSMIWTLYEMLRTYDQYPVNTITKITVKEHMPFPGVTLCNINNVDVEKISLNSTLYRSFREDLATAGFLYRNINNPDMSKVTDAPIDGVVNSTWVEPVGTEFVAGCFINNANTNCSEIFSVIQTSSSRCVQLKTDNPAFRSMLYAGPYSGLRVYINIHQDGYAYTENVAAGVRLHLHEPDVLPDFHSSGLLLSPGTSNYVAVTPVQYKFLPKPYKAYGDDVCIDMADPSDPAYPRMLRCGKRYSYAACNLECTIVAVAEKCGCRGVLNDANSSLPLCTVMEFYTCYERELTVLYFNVSAENRCQCPMPCDFTDYRAQISSAYFPSAYANFLLRTSFTLPQGAAMRENYMELKVFFDKLILDEVIHEPVYTYSSVMGTIGGQMGFFMGASVLTVCELCELCFHFLVTLFRRMSLTKVAAGTHVRVIPVKGPMSPSAIS